MHVPPCGQFNPCILCRCTGDHDADQETTPGQGPHGAAARLAAIALNLSKPGTTQDQQDLNLGRMQCTKLTI